MDLQRSNLTLRHLAHRTDHRHQRALLAAAQAASQRLAETRRADQQGLPRMGRNGVDHLVQMAVFQASTINTRYSSPAVANAAGSWPAFRVRQGRRLCMAIISLISARLTGVFGSLANSV